ncbi:MAG: pseudouridine synthase [Aerococcus sp.]|nr:pseudouridine synthase [Aerococcus sp.]
MERLQKVIAHAGVASRREAEKMIQAGRVKVNGNVVRELGTKVATKDQIEVDSIPIYKEEPVTYLFYKPDGVVSTVSDDKGRKTVLDYFNKVEQRIYPIGRLDYHTTGVLLLTNEGELANGLMHPKSEVEKVYVAKVEGMPTNADLEPLRRGLMIDGRKTAPAKVTLLKNKAAKKNATVQITIHEGRNRQVRKMFEAIGFPVKRLTRTRYAFLTTENLTPGEFRPLVKKEIDALKRLTKKN